MDPEKPLSDDGRARAERNRQEALLRLQRTRSAQSGSIPQSHKKGFNDSSGVKLCAGLPNATSVAQAKANLSRYTDLLLECYRFVFETVSSNLN